MADLDATPPSRFTRRKLFVISFSILFIEMASIRWLNASVTVLSYFNNLILISCFFGLGVGCLLARRRVSLIRAYGVAFLLFVVAVVFLNRHGVEISYGEDVLFVGETQFYSGGLLRLSLSALSGFVLNVALFVILGQELGKQLAHVESPLVAYSYDIAGSLCGVVAYTVVAWLQTPPHIWYAIALLALVAFQRDRRGELWTNAFCAIAGVWLMTFTYGDARWSPYYKIDTHPYAAEENRDLGYVIRVDNLRIQDALRLGPELMSSSLRYWLPYYELPYHFIRPRKVLILGAGAGNEAAMAYMMGAREIRAVEIDPVIASYGRTLHPMRPYAAPEVVSIVDDGRAFLSRTDEKFDLILMSALDSHKQLAGASNLRLESFMYTVEAYARIRELLAPRGVFCLSLASTRPWMGERTYWSLAEAFGRPPRVFKSEGSPFNSESFLFGPDDAFAADQLSWRSPISEVVHPYENSGVTLATDDWPHLYLKEPSIPGLYLIVLAVLIVGSTLLVVGIEPAVRRPSLSFFLLGAGFMLLETRSVTQMALLFGSTWLVNALVFAAILATILSANLLVQGGRAPRLSVAYPVLLMTLAALYFLPFGELLRLDFGWRLAAAALAIGLPILWASILFATLIRDEVSIDRAFGSNLLGVVFGGCVEYTSNLWGLNALFLVALVIYGTSAVVLPRSRWSRALA